MKEKTISEMRSELRPLCGPSVDSLPEEKLRWVYSYAKLLHFKSR